VGLARPGSHPLVFTVQAGTALDLLPATLVLPAEAQAAAPAAGRGVLPMAVAAVALIAAGGVWLGRRRAAA
jgi:hypothetical protein